MSKQSENANNQVVLTNEQFQQLLASLSVRDSPNLNIPSPSQNGNFSKCSSRFNGARDADVNAFINAIIIYKDCLQITDANALKGLPMLLDGFAATWFQGIKNTTNTWQDAINLLRNTFDPQKPPYRVCRELFANEQDFKTPVDIFVCKMRAIIAQLPANTLSADIQLDMVYGVS